MVTGVKYLHDCNIAHGDIKGVSPPTLTKGPTTRPSCSQSNVHIRNYAKPRAILADFCFTRIAAIAMGSSSEDQATPSFMAPELFLSAKFGLTKGKPSKEADIYALGMTIYQVLTGKLPFPQRRKARVMYVVMLGGRPAKPENAEEIGMTDVVWGLLKGCWEEERMTRPNAAEVLKKFYEIASENKPTNPTLKEPASLRAASLRAASLRANTSSCSSLTSVNLSSSSTTASCEWCPLRSLFRSFSGD